MSPSSQVAASLWTLSKNGVDSGVLKLIRASLRLFTIDHDLKLEQKILSVMEVIFILLKTIDIEVSFSMYI